MDLTHLDFAAVLERPADSAEVKALLDRAGFKGAVRATEDKDGNAYVKLTDLGVMLVFGPPGLALREVQFFSTSLANGFKRAYAGTLPRGLMLTDVQADVHRKLGRSDWANVTARTEQWEGTGDGEKKHRLAIRYKRPGAHQKQADMPLDVVYLRFEPPHD